MQEIALQFHCGTAQLCGILARPDSARQTGVVIVVGGPQTRIGSHRQFVLLARRLAAGGFPVLRFDLRGMGDSDGECIDFEQATPDVGAAIDALLTHQPTLTGVVLWGLCDAASASLLYLHQRPDPRVVGVVLANPWVRSDATLAQTHVRHYYGQRFLQRAFWAKLLRGEVDILGGVTELTKKVLRTRTRTTSQSPLDFRARMALAAEQTTAHLFLILSGNDFTAREFEAAAQADPVWQRTLNKQTTTLVAIPEADHTFSSARWRQTAEDHTLRWLETVDKSARATERPAQ